MLPAPRAGAIKPSHSTSEARVFRMTVLIALPALIDVLVDRLAGWPLLILVGVIILWRIVRRMFRRSEMLADSESAGGDTGGSHGIYDLTDSYVAPASKRVHYYRAVG